MGIINASQIVTSRHTASLSWNTAKTRAVLWSHQRLTFDSICLNSCEYDHSLHFQRDQCSLKWFWCFLLSPTKISQGGFAKEEIVGESRSNVLAVVWTNNATSENFQPNNQNWTFSEWPTSHREPYMKKFGHWLKQCFLFSASKSVPCKIAAAIPKAADWVSTLHM